jgi:hypothetical protein
VGRMLRQEKRERRNGRGRGREGGGRESDGDDGEGDEVSLNDERRAAEGDRGREGENEDGGGERQQETERIGGDGDVNEKKRGNGNNSHTVNGPKKRRNRSGIEEGNIRAEPRRKGSRTAASTRGEGEVREERKKREREEEERKAANKKKRTESGERWMYMLRTPMKGGGTLKQAIKVGSVTLDKIAGSGKWIGQGSAEHRTRKRQRETEAATPTRGGRRARP